MPSNSIKTAAALLRANGVSLRRNSSGDFTVRLANAKPGKNYSTDDLDEAVAMGLRLANERDAANPAARAARASKSAAAWEDYNAAYNAAYDAAEAAAEAANAAR